MVTVTTKTDYLKGLRFTGSRIPRNSDVCHLGISYLLAAFLTVKSDINFAADDICSFASRYHDCIAHLSDFLFSPKAKSKQLWLLFDHPTQLGFSARQMGGAPTHRDHFRESLTPDGTGGSHATRIRIGSAQIALSDAGRL
jgi:hypothetical protein